MAASSSSAAADSRPPKYDVFISFRGETRNSFTSHLYSELRKKQINAYIDEKSLEKGDDISPALLKAIEESTVSIIIFSEDYASSRWCLDELVHILKCREEKGQTVLPIFHGIDPSHIRKQEGTYAAAFVKHQERFKEKMDKVQEWRQALTRAADLSGWNSQGKSESVLVQQVVEDVISKLQSISSTSIDDLKGFFGIQRQLCKIESLLCFDSPNVRILGIWGMGGIGKTTLAGVVFKCFSNRFEGACFLESVREESQRKGLVQLKKDVFSKLLGEKDPDVSNHFVNVRLSRTKALLVLDDVDDFEQLRRLVGDRDRFGPGSKIILTSRDFQVLNESIDELYEVQALDLKNEASQLFYLKAFGKSSCRPEYEEISAEVVSYTGGNPLALQVLGSYFKSLGSFGIEKWESALEKLRRILRVDILEVLRISYDGLDDEERDIFLDIACFHKDEKRDFVESILKIKSSIVITDLVHKSLITIDQYGLIRMHDLIQEMGWAIVRQSTKKLGERSRLWTAEDVSYVLENNTGTEAIEGIYLPWNKEDEELHLRPDVFHEMRKLRLLKFGYASHRSPLDFMTWKANKVYIDGDLTYLGNGNLTYLHWEHYPGKSLPSNFKPQNLVELHMPHSMLKQLWDGVQKLGSLKHINLNRSRLLTKIPDLSLAPKLESINVSFCRSLIHIPSLNFQATLDESAFRYPCRPILSVIDLGWCRSLTTLPKVSGNITTLDLGNTALKELPSSIESLENLGVLDLSNCANLKSLPKLPRNIEVLLLDDSGIEEIPSSSIECLYRLRLFSLQRCRRLKSLPSNINLKALVKLTAGESSIQELPSTIENSIQLQRLCLSTCHHLKFIPKTLCKLTILRELSLSDCSKLESLSMLSGLCSLTRLDLSHNNTREIPASIGMFYKLERLDISNCKNLQSLPASIGMLYKLKELDISNCKNLQSLPELPLFIGSVDAEDCSSLEMVSTSRSTHTLGRWLDNDFMYRQRLFTFLNCTNLGEDAINNIFTEFLYKVFCIATTPPPEDRDDEGGELVVCYPTKEIPRWFDNQSEGSSITIKLPPNWYNPKTFLGFVVSFVFEYEDDIGDFDPVECELHLKTNCGESPEEVVFKFSFKYAFGRAGRSSDNMVVWYKYFDHSKASFEKYQEASFEFITDNLKSRYGFRMPDNFKMKQCGVRMLYLKDAIKGPDDGSTANFESWRTDVIDSDDDFYSVRPPIRHVYARGGKRVFEWGDVAKRQQRKLEE